jgi:hypothetical protein
MSTKIGYFIQNRLLSIVKTAIIKNQDFIARAAAIKREKSDV